MFVLGNFLLALANILSVVLTLYTWILIARAIVSWVRIDPGNPVIRILYGLTEPVLGRIRRILRLSYTGLDFSPLIAILCVWFLNRFLVPTLIRMGRGLGG